MPACQVGVNRSGAEILLLVFVAIGLVAFASALYGILAQVQLLAIIRNGRATAVDLAVYLGLDSLDELDALREAQPDLLRVVPGPPGTYEHVEFTFSARRVKALRKKDRMSWTEGLPVRLVSVVLLLAALILGHERTAGWLVLLAAVFVESLRWVVTRSKSSSEVDDGAIAMGEPIYEPDESAPEASPAIADGPSDEEPEEFGEPIYEEDEPAAYVEAIMGDGEAAMAEGVEPPPTLRTFTTIALLRQAWRPAESPIVGGLRRAGQRDAVGASARGGAPDRVRIKCSDMIVNVVNHPEPVAPDVLAVAISQAWHWPEAASATAGHAAHLTIATSFPPDVKMADVIRLHHRAHVAVSEWASVIAVLWPNAGRLTAADELAGLARYNGRLIETCVTIRAFDDNGTTDVPERHVLDTLGLSAIGPIDLELETPATANEEASAALSELAERLLLGEAPPSEGDEIEWPGLGSVIVKRQRALYDPSREVLHIAQLDG